MPDAETGAESRPNRRSLPLAVLSTAVLTFGAISGVQLGTESESAAASRLLDYVALGDSYSSGVGAPPYTDESGSCSRSDLGYPQLWADDHDLSTFAFIACSGATTDDVFAQTESETLNWKTDLVTVTVGGNDVGFSATLLACLTGDDDACLTAVEAGSEKINTELPEALDTVYAEIHSQAPRADIVVLGYPRLLDTGVANVCLNETKSAALNQVADELNAVIEERATAAGAEYVDVSELFEGHGACGASSWLNAPASSLTLEAFHPTAEGYADGYAAALTSAIG